MNRENRMEIFRRCGFENIDSACTWSIDSQGVHCNILIDANNQNENCGETAHKGSLYNLLGEFDDCCYEYVKDKDWEKHGLGIPNQAYRMVNGILNLLCGAERKSVEKGVDYIRDMLKKKEIFSEIMKIILYLENDIECPDTRAKYIRNIIDEKRNDWQLTATEAYNITGCFSCGISEQKDMKRYVADAIGWNLDECYD